MYNSHKSNRRIRILHVVLKLEYGGTEKIVVDVVNGMRRETFNSFLLCMDGYGERANTVRSDVPIYVMNRKPGISPVNFYRFYKLFKKINPDIVHFRNFTTYFWGCIPSRFKKKTRVILSDNSAVVRHIESNNRKKLILRKFLRYFTDGYMTNSMNFKNKLLECTELDDKDVEVIPNGVDTERYYPMETDDKKIIRSKYGFNENDYIIGIVAGLRPVKNLSLAIQSMKDIAAIIPSAKLVIAGRGEQERELKDLARKIGISDKVIFLGLVEEVNELLNTFDLFLFTSSSAEGMPNAVLEAMAAKVTVVASDIPGNVEVLNNGKRGYLFRNNDKDSLVNTLVRVASDREALREKTERAHTYAESFKSHTN